MTNGKTTIAFDFDWTLRFPDGDPVEKNVKLFHRFKRNGHTVYIVTSRPSDMFADLEAFVKQHNLQPDGIFYTEGQSKAPTLKKLDVDVFFDDDDVEIDDATDANIKAFLVWSGLHTEKWNSKYN